MNKHEKNHLAELKDIDERSVEEVSQYYPMLGKSAKKRILEKCLEKTNISEFVDDEDTVSGTEVYRRPVLSRVLGIAAAIAAAFGAVTGTIYLNRHFNTPEVFVSEGSSGQGALINTTTKNDEIKETSEVTVIVTEAATEDVTAEVSVMIQETMSQYTYSTTFTSSTTSTDTTETTETTTEETTDENEVTTETATEAAVTLSPEFFIGTWYASNGSETREFDFYSDGTGGRVYNSSNEENFSFVYDIKGNNVNFRFMSAEMESASAVIIRYDEEHFSLQWAESGMTESFVKKTA